MSQYTQIREPQTEHNPEQIAAEDQLASRRNFSDKGLDSILDYHRLYRLDDRLFERFTIRYSAASMAWMAGGMALDGEQEWPPGGFHKHFSETRNATSTKEERKHIRNSLSWHATDMLTALDRVSGGATIMMHIDGNTRPGTPITPEAMQPVVYCTPFICRDIPNADIVIARLTQMFTESIAVPTLRRWEGAMAAIGVKLGQKTIGVGRRPYRTTPYDYNSPPPLLPPARPKSSTYIIPGRPVGALEKAIEHFHPELVDRTNTAASNSSQQPSKSDAATSTSRRNELVSLYEELQAEYEDVQAAYEAMDKQLVESRARVAYLEKQVAARDNVLRRLSKDARRLLDNVELAIDSEGDFNELDMGGPDMNSEKGQGLGREASPATAKAISDSEADVSMSATNEELDSPLRRLVRLSRPGSSPPVHTIPLRRSPMWEDVQPFGAASKEVMDRFNMWEEHLRLPHIRDILNDATHKEWYDLLMRYTMEAPRAVRELVKAMHIDSGLGLDDACCT